MLAERLQTERASRLRGKAYDRLLWCYFADLAPVIRHMRAVLRPGARAVWVVGDSAPYGIRVDTPSLIAQLATEIGLEVVDDEPLRARGARWAGLRARHSLRLSERMIVLRRRFGAVQEPLPGLEV
jgi:hypothetical protein